MSQWQGGGGLQIARPGKAVTGIMLALFGVWLVFAMALNWGDASEELFLLFCGNTERILHGEVWRLFTAPWMHLAQGNVGHILWALLGLFFLTPALEARWGGPRLLRFLLFSGVIAYGFQMLAGLVLSNTAQARLIPEYWFGSFPVLEAIAIAWALSFKNQQVRLMFVLPVSAKTLVAFVVGLSVLRVIAAQQSPEGLLSPFGGMLAGWLLGAGTPSPLRRAYLTLKLRKVENDARRDRARRGQNVKGSHLKSIDGGRAKRNAPRGPDGRWLN